MIKQDFFDEKNVVLTVAAFSDVHCSNAERGEKLATIFRKAEERFSPDVFLIAGDVGEALPRDTDKPWLYPELSCFVEYAVMGNEKKKPFVWCLGNHDGPAYAQKTETVSFSTVKEKKNYTVTRGMTSLDVAEMVIRDTSPELFYSGDAFPLPALAAPKGFRYSRIKGYSFFAIDYSYANEQSLAWLYAQIAALAEKEPRKTVFVTSHMPKEDRECPEGLADCLAKFPQVLYIAGHTHIHIEDHTFISDKGGNQLILGTCSHGCLGLHIPHPKYYHYQIKQGAVLRVDAAGRVQIEGVDYSFMREEDGTVTDTLGESGKVVERPMCMRTVVLDAPTADKAGAILLDTGIHDVSDPRYFKPYFEKGAAIGVKRLADDLVEITFPTARASNFISCYHVSVFHMAHGRHVSLYDEKGECATELLAVASSHILTGKYENIPETQSLLLRGAVSLPAQRQARLVIYGHDDFGEVTDTISVMLP